MAQQHMVIFEQKFNKHIMSRKDNGMFLFNGNGGLREATSYVEEPILAQYWSEMQQFAG